jgi:hypothetical protein
MPAMNCSSGGISNMGTLLLHRSHDRATSSFDSLGWAVPSVCSDGRHKPAARSWTPALRMSGMVKRRFLAASRVSRPFNETSIQRAPTSQVEDLSAYIASK